MNRETNFLTVDEPNYVKISGKEVVNELQVDVNRAARDGRRINPGSC